MKSDTHGTERLRVIVRTKSGARDEVRLALEGCGASIRAEHKLIHALTVDVTTKCLKSVVESPNVESAGADFQVRASQTATIVLVDNDTANTAPYSLRDTVGLSPYSSGYGIGVAVIDSGIAPVPALAAQIMAFYDFTGGGTVETAPNDGYGHGTHVAGLIGASDANYMGIAPGVHFVGLKVLDASGQGQTSDVIRALEFAALNRTALNIHIVNLSLGHGIMAPAADDALVQAVEAAVGAGLVVTVSAGNYGTNPNTGEVGYAGIGSPGNAPSAITSGAVDTKATLGRFDDGVTAYSSRGPTWYDGFAKPDVVAPGHKLVSVADPSSYLFQTYPQYTSYVGDQAYLTLSGTSMASAVTAGVVATILEMHQWYAWLAPDPLPGPTAVKAMLQYSAVPLRKADGTPEDQLTQGTGGINAEGATRIAANVGWLA
ncbi:MAG: S8 family serine peptidase, partial [Acidobacteria bacterium]|nr:S8 family serine peptidase [Acidobacteriota bacterium]